MPCSAARRGRRRTTAPFVRNGASGSPVVHPPLPLALASPSCCGGCSAVVHGLGWARGTRCGCRAPPRRRWGRAALGRRSPSSPPAAARRRRRRRRRPGGGRGAAAGRAAAGADRARRRRAHVLRLQHLVADAAEHGRRGAPCAPTCWPSPSPTRRARRGRARSRLTPTSSSQTPRATRAPAARVAGLRPGKMYAVSLTASSDVGEGPASRPLAVPMRSAAACAAEAPPAARKPSGRSLI